MLTDVHCQSSGAGNIREGKLQQTCASRESIQKATAAALYLLTFSYTQKGAAVLSADAGGSRPIAVKLDCLGASHDRQHQFGEF
jgi:hypothetical protein